MSDNKVKFELKDCPTCNGGGYIAPPPTYRSKRCNHQIVEKHLYSEIQEKKRNIESAETALREARDEVYRYQGLLAKYFKKKKVGQQTTLQDFTTDEIDCTYKEKKHD